MAETTVESAWCVGIRAKYLGPTNYMGSRWRVWRADETYANDPDAMTVGYFHELSTGADNAGAAIEQYLARKKERAIERDGADGSGWPGRWIVACGSVDGYVAVRVPR